MRKLFSIILLTICYLSAFSLVGEGRYTSRMTQDGVLYFFFPQKIKDLSGIKSFEYDITLLTWTDSATVNFTFESATMLLPENLRIAIGTDTIKCTSYKPLFLDLKKNHYEIRITSQFSLQEIDRIFNSITPPCFLFSQGDDQKEATYRDGAWRKDRKKLLDIYKIFLYSKWN